MKDFNGIHIQGTETQKNLRKALQGEALARSKYFFYEEQAREEGQEDIAQLYARMARNESYHCKLWFQYLNGRIPNTVENIQESTQGEMSESQSMYPGFAKVAREEGLDEIADLFDMVADIEKTHADTFLKALSTLTQKKATAKTAPESLPKDQYRCMFCGAVFEERPDVCPVCEAIGSFELIVDEE